MSETTGIGDITQDILKDLKEFQADEDLLKFDEVEDSPPILDFSGFWNEIISGCTPYNKEEVQAILVEVKRINEFPSAHLNHLIKWLESDEPLKSPQEKMEEYRRKKDRIKSGPVAQDVMKRFPVGTKVHFKEETDKNKWKIDRYAFGTVTSYYFENDEKTHVYVDWRGDGKSDLFENPDELKIVKIVDA